MKLITYKLIVAVEKDSEHVRGALDAALDEATEIFAHRNELCNLDFGFVKVEDVPYQFRRSENKQEQEKAEDAWLDKAMKEIAKRLRKS